jgi:hypothetical protein
MRKFAMMIAEGGNCSDLIDFELYNLWGLCIQASLTLPLLD